MFEISVTLNVILLIWIFVIISKAKSRIIEEKLTTFAGCLNAITYSLLYEESEKRYDTLTFGLASLCGHENAVQENMKFYVLRASFVRYFRGACLADLGEHTRYLALQIAGDDDEIGNQIMEHISSPEADDAGNVIEPKVKFGEETLVAAQFVAEKKVLAHYQRQITAVPIKLFG